MRQFFKFFLASLLAMMVAGFLFFIVLFGIIGAVGSSMKSIFDTSNSSKEKVVKGKTILKINLSDAIPENDAVDPWAFFNNETGSVGLYKVITAIKEAAGDDNVVGIYLRADGNANSMATSQQLRDALTEFKKSGKFIYAYGDAISQSAYFIASVADSVFVNPMGSVEIKGLSSQIVFLKGALDKLEVEPEIFFAGKFKSATEPFRMKEMSEPNRTQLAAMIKDNWDVMLAAFAEHTKKDITTINNWAQTGEVQTSKDAKARGIIDAIYYTDELETLLKSKSGLKEKDQLNLTSIKDYAQTVTTKKTGDKIALLLAEGEIVDNASSNTFSNNVEIAADDIIQTIRKIRDNDNIKAVVLRVNSPGGSALASEKILRELDLMRKVKPLVVSMGDLAASGGYYISSHADSIFALPTTITGSIGVFGMMFNSQKFFNSKLGITFDVEKNAPYADLGNANRPMTQQEKEFIQSGVDTVYSVFKNRVATGRHKTMAYVDSIGQGRVWTGKAGMELGLVDAMGDIDRAMKSAAKLASLGDYMVDVYPKVKNPMEKLFANLSKEDIKQMISAEAMLKAELGDQYEWYKILKKMKEGHGHNFMLMPFIPKIN